MEQEPRPEEAHDVLAADEFAVPAPDPELHHHGPVELPDDPTGVAEPHDVLAAEEFPMPAPPSGAPMGSLADRPGGLPRLAIELAVGLILAALLLRRRR